MHGTVHKMKEERRNHIAHGHTFGFLFVYSCLTPTNKHVFNRSVADSSARLRLWWWFSFWNLLRLLCPNAHRSDCSYPWRHQILRLMLQKEPLENSHMWSLLPQIRESPFAAPETISFQRAYRPQHLDLCALRESAAKIKPQLSTRIASFFFATIWNHHTESCVNACNSFTIKGMPV